MCFTQPRSQLVITNYVLRMCIPMQTTASGDFPNNKSNQTSSHVTKIDFKMVVSTAKVDMSTTKQF